MEKIGYRSDIVVRGQTITEQDGIEDPY